MIRTALTALFLTALAPTTALAQSPADPTPPVLLTAPTPLLTDPAPGPSPEVPEPPAPPVATGTTLLLETEQFSLKIAGRLQSRWELFHDSDGDDATDEELTNRFSVARARLTVEGQVFGSTNYKMQTEFGKGFTYLRDYYLDRPLGGIRLRTGQFKKPFSRQQITSSGSQQLVDRSLTDAVFDAGRDLGVMLHNGYEKSPDGLEWAVGLVNGTGDRPITSCSTAVDPTTMAATTTCKTPSNVPTDIGPTLVARAGWNLGGIKGYSESDLEGGPLRVAAGVSYMGNLAEGDPEQMVHRAQADVLVKVKGASLTAAAYVKNHRVAGERVTDLGFHLQGGMFLSPKKSEIAVRLSEVPSDVNKRHEAIIGFNFFLHGHALKWQTDAGVIHTTGTEVQTDLQVRTQAQLTF